MKISQLRYFCEVCKLQNVSKAAEVLYVSQPAISAAIRALESELQVTLFLRSRNRLTLTAEGVALNEMAKEILSRVDSIPEQIRSMTQRRTTISVGLPPLSSAFYIPKLFKIKQEYEKLHPNVEVEVVEFPSFAAMCDLLDSGKLDLALSALEESSFAEMDKLTLFQTPIMLCVGPNHPLVKEKRVSIHQFYQEPLARTYHSASAMYRVINSYYSKNCYTPNYKYSFTQSKAAELLLLENQAVLLARPEMEYIDSKLVAIPLEEPLMIDIGVLWSSKQPITSEVAAFVERLKQVNFRSVRKEGQTSAYLAQMNRYYK